ncbi:wee1-like protein kinase 2 [Pollicipes pollicipes]|uniref:wee1-like protein kinase 2 n=1 Tax=Pollicipes pollicipes TaxID=41117 RepID=UPI001885854E|nr:wee1-like protein kinase 2 [Pollicipes pollicipes]
MNSIAQKIDFTMLSDEEPENGCELSINSMSSGCDTDDFKQLSPAAGSPRRGGDSLFQAPAMTSSPRRLSRPPPASETPALPKHASRLVRDRLGSTSPSPPYKRIKGELPPYEHMQGLHLGDVPTTPRTILEDCMMPPQTPRDVNANSLLRSRPYCRKVAARTRVLGSASVEREAANKPAANINPFTPRGRQINERKRLRDSISGTDGSLLSVSTDCSTDGEADEALPTKRLALADANVSRLEKEFIMQGEVGSGQFGQVFRCTNRLDGCTYAIKRSHKPVAGSSHERSALNEVYAHAVLGKHQYIVRYYSAWAERNHMLIQNEFCTRSSLAALLEQHRAAGTLLPEAEIKRMITHVARGLRYIHSMRLCHLDLKPGNIFLTDNELFSGERRAASRMEDDASVVSSDDGFDEDLAEEDDEVIYKIGDFGHVTALDDSQVEEGDCRYMPREILQEDYSSLAKADMFALGLTAYECASGQPLPKNGKLWQQLRNGVLPPLPGFSDELYRLIRLLIDPDPARRPSAAELLAHPYQLPASCRSRAQLRRQLNAERLQNQRLRSQLADLSAHGSPERGAAAAGGGDGGGRLLGRGTPRSRSSTF